MSRSKPGLRQQLAFRQKMSRERRVDGPNEIGHQTARPPNELANCLYTDLPFRQFLELVFVAAVAEYFRL
jgi:hypothetical protein